MALINDEPRAYVRWGDAKLERFVKRIDRENQRLRDALYFYANKSSWTWRPMRYVGDEQYHPAPPAQYDRGERARQALAALGDTPC
jgi:hypothetical protein